ncbi:MAG: WD40 repeat domain-containing protein [Treponema sp.]|jgi:hypothetical protein|nr:WD40 repeat domain-containing protein [Treponema sp.]
MQGQLRTICFAAVFCTLALAGTAAVCGSDWAFNGIMPGGHRGKVNAIINKGDIVLSAGEDGFLEVWDSRSAKERFQASPYSIIAMAERPGTDEVCLLESDGLGLYRISAWNYKERQNIFSSQLRDPKSSVFYSMGGNFIIAAGAGRSGLVLIDSSSGDLLQAPQSLSGSVGIAATGRSERNMVVYLASGSLSYWDLQSGNETTHFDVPANLSSPVLFGNNRYFAGVGPRGLSVINAVSGEVVVQDSSIPGDSLLCPAGDEFVCLVRKEGAAEVSRYAIDRQEQLSKTGSFSLDGRDRRFTSIAAAANSGSAIAMGTGDGSIILAAMNGQPRTLAVKEQTRISEAEISGATIAFISDNGAIGFIPLDYRRISARQPIRTEQNQEAYTRITAFSGTTGTQEQFIFWHDGRTRTQPLVRSSNSDGSRQPLSDISFRSPIRASDSLGGKILFLDATGNLSVVSPSGEGRKAPFTFFSVGLMDAAFIDQDRLIICRSAVSGNTPFMIININTGETVPLPYPSPAGVLLHRGASGNIYAAAISSPNESDGMKTMILHIDPAHIADSAMIVDFQGEDTRFSLAESPDGIAATIGGEGAAIYSNGGGTGGADDDGARADGADTVNIQRLERTGGLPIKLINGGPSLISLDGDGSICWHDSRSGKLLAVFRLHSGEWTLQTERGNISGNLRAGPP